MLVCYYYIINIMLFTINNFKDPLFLLYLFKESFVFKIDYGVISILWKLLKGALQFKFRQKKNDKNVIVIFGQLNILLYLFKGPLFLEQISIF